MSHVFRAPEVDEARPATDSTPSRSGRWMRPDEVRVPLTVAEGKAALNMIDAAIARIEGIIMQREARSGHRDLAMRGLAGAWESKRSEVVYHVARIEAGDSPASVEAEVARQRAEHAEAEVTALRAELRAAREAARETRPARNLDMERQIADLVEKNARLTRELEAARGQRSAETEREKYRRGLRDALALAAVTVQEMIDAGAPVSPLAAFVVVKARRDLPAGFVREWRALQLPHILPYAVETLQSGAWREVDHG